MKRNVILRWYDLFIAQRNMHSDFLEKLLWLLLPCVYTCHHIPDMFWITSSAATSSVAVELLTIYICSAIQCYCCFNMTFKHQGPLHLPNPHSTKDFGSICIKCEMLVILIWIPDSCSHLSNCGANIRYAHKATFYCEWVKVQGHLRR